MLPTAWLGVDLILVSQPGPVGTGSYLLESLSPLPCVCLTPPGKLSKEHGPQWSGTGRPGLFRSPPLPRPPVRRPQT